MSEHIIPVRTYVVVCLVLLLLTATTVVASTIDLGAWSLVVALGIAALKGSLVVLYFMHARQSPILIRMVILAALLWLGILMVGTLDDAMTRAWMHVPGR